MIGLLMALAAAVTAPALIAGHTWRPPLAGNRAIPPFADRPCEYMNCRRPRAEHARAASKQVQHVRQVQR